MCTSQTGSLTTEMIIFRWCLLLFICSNKSVVVSYRLYRTIDEDSTRNANTMHCLYGAFSYPISPNELTHLGRLVYVATRYCLGVKANNRRTSVIPTTRIIHGHEFSFDTLRGMGVTQEQLYRWYAPIDTIEAYIQGAKDGKFFNCSKDEDDLWFGPQCQYSVSGHFVFDVLGLNPYMDWVLIGNEVIPLLNSTCYVMLESDCKSILCLDWREICDGKADCANGLDEYRCREVEMNQCNNDTEFRCQNGHCIDKILFLDGDADCLDSSDEVTVTAFRPFNDNCDGFCEDNTCPLTWFSCGDGTCYDGPKMNPDTPCRTKRDQLYFQRMPPSTYTLFSHVSLIYNGTQAELICYNHTQCPQLSQNHHAESTWQNDTDMVCRRFLKMMNRSFSNFDEMISAFKDFVRSCSLPSIHDLSATCSMFACENSTRCLSYHRLSDGNRDCPNGEDEQQADSCSFGLPNRFMCDNGTRCIQTTLLDDALAHCIDKSDEFSFDLAPCLKSEPYGCYVVQMLTAYNNITFSSLCDGIQHFQPNIDNDTDESDCLNNEWPCLNTHTKCNGVWNCPDGQDELGCQSRWGHLTPCSLNYSHFCLNITNGIPFCLPHSKAGDNHIDCVGSTDERSFCRAKYPYDFMRRYRCRNSDICISPFQTCDCHQDCPENDDETSACLWINNGREPFCDSDSVRCRDGTIQNCGGRLCRCRKFTQYCTKGEDQIFCELIDHNPQTSLFIDLHANQKNTQPQIIERRFYKSGVNMQWKCNHGLFVRSTESPFGFSCFCSQFYYGEYCQYQRKRVSLILQPFMVDSFAHASIFKLVALLVRQNTTILSHDQFVYMSQAQCLSKYKINLLFPINESWSPLTHYSVHIHVFLAETMEYRGSSFWTLPFTFLPVIRLARLVLLSDIIMSTRSSSHPAYHGNCTTCPVFAPCIGHDVDLSRDVCICPLNRIGSRCLISVDPCQNSSCNEHGRCVSIFERVTENFIFRCICNRGWYGVYCEFISMRMNLTVTADVEMVSFQKILVHMMTRYGGIKHLTYFLRLQNQPQSSIITADLSLSDADFAVVQLLENTNTYDFYLLAPMRNNSDLSTDQNVSFVLSPSNRCISVKTLLNRTILAQPPLRRVKYFHRICRPRDSKMRPHCFYDEKLICFCDATNHAYCFGFDTATTVCTWNKCSSRGKCIQNHDLCPTSSLCLCEPCSYGSICQFTTSGYSVSLDAILGSHVQTITPNIFHHSTVIQLSILIVSVVTMVGVVFNMFGIGTFLQNTTRRVGCGLYLLTSSLLGLLTMITLMCKIMLLTSVEQQDISCALVEFLLKWWPTCIEWLYAFVAIERALAVVRQAKYSCQASQQRARIITIVLLVSIGALCVPELIYNRVVVDQEDYRAWCVFSMDSNRRLWRKLYSALDLLFFISPLAINLTTSALIIMGTLRSKEKTMKNNTNGNESIETVIGPSNGIRQLVSTLGIRLIPIKTQVNKHKHILIAPALLTTFSMSRLVMSFISVCKKLDRNPLLTLFAYLAGFFPAMSILFAYILPSQSYRKACFICIKSMSPSHIQNRFRNRRHRRI